MNLRQLTIYLVKQPQFYGHLGNSFFIEGNKKRINIKGIDSYFIIEQQTLFNFKVKFCLGKYGSDSRTVYIVASDEKEFFTKIKLAGNYYSDFPNENYIVI